MPLVIAVVIIIFIFVKLHDDKKSSDKRSATWEKDRRKTNATMERNLVDYYMKHGYSFDDAFRKSYEDMIAAGYQPCIPRSAYSRNERGVQSSYCLNPRKYDSFWVQQKRDALVYQWTQAHPGEPIPYEAFDAEVYKDFPQNDAQYLRDLKLQSVKVQAIPVGEYLIYPKLGTCEVLAHNYGAFGATYTLKVLSSGQVVSHIKIGDKKITRQGKG